jgi:tetratricopeptide (TPR) repeat protein
MFRMLNNNLGRFAITFFLILLYKTVCPINSYSEDVQNKPFTEFNTEFKASIGDKVYILKMDDSEAKKVHGIINGIKKNRDNSIYMLIEFQEVPLLGTPVFYNDRVVGMVYRQSTTGDLFEAMPVKVILDFIKSVGFPLTEKVSKIEKGDRGAEDKNSEVRGYIEKREYDRALKVLQDALKEDPDNPGLHGWMGVVMMETGKPNLAVSEFKKALAIEPGNADFYNGLGYAMLSMGSLDDAIKSFQEAIRINPRHADAHYGIGTAYINTGQVKLATKEYVILKEIDEKMADSLFKLIIRSGSSETQ